MSVNKAWRQFFEQNGGTDLSCGVGANYIAVCDGASGAGSEEAQVLAEGLRGVIAGQHEAFCLEYPCHSPEEERWFNVCVTRFEGQGPLLVAVAHENITQRKRAEATLIRREEFQRTLLDNFPNGSVNVFDRDLRYELAAGRGLEQSGIDPEQLLGRTLAEIFPPEQAALAKSHYEKALSGQTVEFELPLGERCYSICAAPLHVHEGEVLNIVAVAQDITQRKQAEDLIRTSEANLAAAQQIAHLGSWEWSLQSLQDFEGNPLSWSDEVFRIFGHQPGAFEASYEAFMDAVHPDDRHKVDAMLRWALETGQNYNIEHRAVRPDGAERIIQGRSDIIYGEHGTPQKMVGTVQDITEQKQTEESMRQSSEHLRALAASLSTIREEERTQIARDVHDVLGQALTGLKMDVAWLEERLLDDHAEPEGPMLLKTRSMRRLIDATIQSVQRIAAQLRPALLDDFGLEAAIEWQVEEWKERTGVRCDYVSSLGDVVLSPEQSTAVFRILQEALTNITRHAAASRVSILLEENAGHLVLEVQDNGRGMKERRASIANMKSLGVLGMQERARLVDGEVTIDGSEGRGTTVRVRIPLSPEQIQGLHQAEAGREEQA